MDGLDSLRAENDALRKRIEGMDAIIQEVRKKRDEAEKNCEILAAEIESLRQERNAARADLAQMKSTLSDTKQTLRAVQEDRDEFAAKMNDAVERAEALQSRCTDLEGICAAKKREISDLLAEKVSLLQESCQLKVECGEFKEKLDKAKQDAADLESLKKIIAGFGEAFRFVVEHWRGGGT